MRYCQRWQNHMEICHKPVIEKLSKEQVFRKKDYTKIVFEPDLNIFSTRIQASMHHKNEASFDDLVHILMRRVFDVAACVYPVKVSFNGEAIPVSNFLEYVSLYKNLDVADKGYLPETDKVNTSDINDVKDTFLCSTKVGTRWEVAVIRFVVSVCWYHRLLIILTFL